MSDVAGHWSLARKAERAVTDEARAAILRGDCRGGTVHSFANKTCRCDICRQIFTESRRSLYHGDVDRRRAYNRSQHVKHRAKRLSTQRQKAYGLTPAEFEAMLTSQGGVCKICLGPPRGGKTAESLNVDHCHETGKVRGLLCAHCNRTLGMMEDDPARLRAAAAYLEASK